MIKGFLKITCRHLLRRKGHLFINIAGLAIGLASSILILMFVRDELSYDRHHEHADRIYRISLRVNMQGSQLHAPITPAPMAAAILQDLPEVRSVVRLYGFSSAPSIRSGDRHYIERNLVYADSSVFDVFTFNMLRGDKKNALNRPNTLVLTESAALKYFGSEDPLGKTLELGNDRALYQVTGIMEDPPGNSHFSFDVMASFTSVPEHQSFTWIGNFCYTYILLEDFADPGRLEAKFPAMLETYLGPQIENMMGTTLEEIHETGGEWGYQLQPLTRIHLHSDLQGEIQANGNITTVRVFSLIALLILVIAGINYTNLSTARSAGRAKEIGLKKVVGSGKSQLIYQFLGESVFLSFISMIIAMCLVEIFIPAFNNIAGKDLQVQYFTTWYTMPLLALISIIVGFFSGSYPAFFLSSFSPLNVLKGRLHSGMKSSSFRSFLVAFQFLITIVLLISTFTVYRQIDFMSSKDLGMNPENVLVIHRFHSVPEENRETFSQELTNYPGILASSIARSIPGLPYVGDAFRRDGAPSNEQHVISNGWVDHDYARVLGLKLVEGRFFSRDFASDSLAVVLNETAVRALGYDDPVTGKKVINTGQGGTMEAPEDLAFTIIGVVRDFHFQSLHQSISPLVLSPGTQGNYLLVKIAEGEEAGAIDIIRDRWNDFVDEQPLNYSFLSDDLNLNYGAEQRTGLIISIFAVLSILIASLGLLGLASYAAEQRTKEIGIRKALGASVGSVMLLLSKEINVLVIISTLLAWPVAWYFMNGWLENFAYRVEIGIAVFLLASVLTYLVALATVSFQAWKFASLNPVNTLRDE